MNEDVLDRAREAFAAYRSGLGKEIINEMIAEIEQLRTALKECPCPGGGWSGMPERMEATIANCMAHDACGCSFGVILRHMPGRKGCL